LWKAKKALHLFLETGEDHNNVSKLGSSTWEKSRMGTSERQSKTQPSARILTSLTKLS